MEDEKLPDAQVAVLNDELLAPPPKDASEPAKRGTKAALIEKILEVADRNDLELTVSNTQLKRMNKQALQKLLGELVEAGVKRLPPLRLRAPVSTI